MENKIIEIRRIDKRGFFKGKADEDEVKVLYTDTNEIVEGRVFSKRKSLYCTDIRQIKKKSKNRIEPKCNDFSKCGGCCYQHLTYDREKKIKISRVKRVLGLEPVSFEFSSIYNYRNSLEFDISHNKAGMHPRMSSYVINIEECKLMDEEINKYLKNTVQPNKDNFEGEIRIVKGKNKTTSRWYPKYESKETDIKNLKYIKKQYKNKVFYISPDTFFQANDELYGRWLDKIKQLVMEEGNFNKILELFSGVGTISIFLEDIFNKITMIENNELSNYLARKTIYKNNISESKFQIVKMDLYQNKPVIENVDVLIVNPPRAGLSKKIIKFINENSFKFIIYSSCNYNTFARDIKKLEQFKVDKYYIYDMFPRTYHFEILAKLKKKGNNG